MAELIYMESLLFIRSSWSGEDVQTDGYYPLDRAEKWVEMREFSNAVAD